MFIVSKIDVEPLTTAITPKLLLNLKTLFRISRENITL